MHAKLDENMPVEATELLRAAGWACDTVPDEGLGGEEDAKIAAACRAEARVLFSLDLDFSDIRAYPPNEYVRHRGVSTGRAQSMDGSSDAGQGSSRAGCTVGGPSTLDRRARSCPCAWCKPASCLTAHAPDARELWSAAGDAQALGCLSSYAEMPTSHKMRVNVVAPDPEWQRQFELESDRLSGILGNIVVAIHHIGSTAIPGMFAKPIIDILLEVDDIHRLDNPCSAMESLGYEGSTWRFATI